MNRIGDGAVTEYAFLLGILVALTGIEFLSDTASLVQDGPND